MTEVQIVQYLIQGGFAALFIWLFLDTRKESKAREERLMVALEKLAHAYDELAFVRKIND